MFKLHTAVIYRGNNNHTLIPEIKSGVITKVGRDTVWLDNAHKSEDQVYAAFLYPDTPECRAFLQAGIDLSLKHQAEQTTRMTEEYQFNNALVRAGLK